MDRSLAGREVDRPPVSFWYHFGVQHAPGQRIAEVSLEFFRYYDLDWLKLMNDYFYPMPAGTWRSRPPETWDRVKRFDPRDTAWAEQLKAVSIVVQQLQAAAYVIDTVFEPWQVLLRNLVGEHLEAMVEQAPQAVLDALDVITDNVIAYCRESLRLGSRGIFLSTFGSAKQVPRERYVKFAKPFVKRIFEAIKDAGPMNTAHVHDVGIYVDDAMDLPVPILSYEDRHPSNPGIPQMRAKICRVNHGRVRQEPGHASNPGRGHEKCPRGDAARGPDPAAARARVQLSDVARPRDGPGAGRGRKAGRRVGGPRCVNPGDRLRHFFLPRRGVRVRRPPPHQRMAGGGFPRRYSVMERSKSSRSGKWPRASSGKLRRSLRKDRRRWGRLIPGLRFPGP